LVAEKLLFRGGEEDEQFHEVSDLHMLYNNALHVTATDAVLLPVPYL